MTPEQQFLVDLWEEHLRDEFTTRDTDATLDTMTPDAYVNHIPVLAGGVGYDELHEFYSRHFIPKMPPDTAITPPSRTVGADRLVDEMIFCFTHTIEMDGCARHRAHWHIHWDQASVLVRIGLLDAAHLPVAGSETAKKVLNPALPSNALIRRAERISN